MSNLGDPKLQRWVEEARVVQHRAWAPYSRFKVGAVLVDATGELHLGCNVENVSFGATICAERTALGNAIVKGVRNFQAVVVATDADRPVFPCGICRQVLAEFEPNLDVYAVNRLGQVSHTTLDKLLPSAFESQDL